MRDAFPCILARLPFPVLEIHPDNSSEFFNHHMRAFWKDTLGLFELSRSHPCHKNDDRFVEQKNSIPVPVVTGCVGPPFIGLRSPLDSTQTLPPRSPNEPAIIGQL